MLIATLSAVFVLLTGGLAGVLAGVELAVVPMLAALPGDRFIEVHRLLDRRFDPTMPRTAQLALITGLTLVIITPGTAGRVAFGLALSAVVAVALISELGNVRMNRRIDSWPPGDPPDGWTVLRAGWARANRVRTAAAAAGFLAAVIGAVSAAT
jgi:hypothetical protein